MGRPTKFSRPEAVEIAMNTFWEKGYKPTSVSDLASAMSITRSSFYNSFHSREEIFDEAVSLYRQTDPAFDIDPDQEGFSPAGPIRHFFSQVCDNLAAATDSRGCLLVNCYAQCADHEQVPAGVQDFVDTRRAQFKKTVELAVERGLMPADTDIDGAADSLVTFLIGINITGKRMKNRDRLWASVDTMLNGMGLTEAA